MADNYLEKKMEYHRSAAPRRCAFHRSAGRLSVDFPQRRVFVTGGAKGIGRAIVQAFSAAGCRVAFCDSDLTSGTATAAETGAQFHHVDVTDTDSLIAAMNLIFSRWGDIDVIINNVGVGNFKPLVDTEIDDFDRVLATNLRPAFITARQLARHRRTLVVPNGFGGRIINISSTRHAMSEPGTEAYSASKGALRSLTHALMASLAPLHITVNSISPGWIVCNPEEQLSEADRLQHPSQRAGKPEDIARICLFLTAPGNDFINGADIVADGGMTHKMIYVD